MSPLPPIPQLEAPPSPRVANRQVHLDFHTSEHIPDIGARFDAAQFQQALRLGHVGSICVFAKCHHGLCYYPTRVDNVHPNLARPDLLGEQIEAAHAIGVRAPIYITLGWSVRDADEHPEWYELNRDGSPRMMNVDFDAKPDDPRPHVSWIHLCPSGAYRERLLAVTEEVCAMYPVDGLFYDICFMPPCFCENCRRGMRDAGLREDDHADATRYNVWRWQSIAAELRRILSAPHPEASIYFNGPTNVYGWDWLPTRSHYELEDLPTTWDGYDKFPLNAKFYSRLGKPCIAMSGKFHSAWGEFGGFKAPEAIRFEAAAMTGFGTHCNFGDQLHPSGLMDMQTYRNIGHAFEYVERIEEYGLGGKHHARLGFWIPPCHEPFEGSKQRTPHDRGVLRMLLENQVDFEACSNGDDLSHYETILLTGATRLPLEDIETLRRFHEGGGKLMLIGEALLLPDRDEPAFACGARYLGPANYRIDYLKAPEGMDAKLPETPFLCYESAARYELEPNSLVLAAIHEPYFDRNYAHFCSHQNTPNRLEPAPHPGAWLAGRVLAIPHPLGKIYFDMGARAHRDWFKACLDRIYTDPALEVDMPSAAQVNLLHQPERGRYVAHLLYGPPLSRGCAQVIEDLVPLHDVPLRLRLDQTIRRATLPLEDEELELRDEDGRQALTVPRVQAHQIVCLEY